MCFLQSLISFLDSRKQRVLLNGQCSWGFINTGVPQDSFLGPLLLLIYIDDLTENLKSNPKLFTDETSLLTLINHPNATAKQLCEDLDKIRKWVFQWKLSSNPDPSKQAQERKKLFSLVRSKRLYIRQFSLIINQFNKFHHKNT